MQVKDTAAFKLGMALVQMEDLITGFQEDVSLSMKELSACRHRMEVVQKLLVEIAQDEIFEHHPESNGKLLTAE